MDTVLHFAVAQMMGDFTIFFCNTVNYGLADRYKISWLHFFFQVVHPRCVSQIIQYVFIVFTTLYINIISTFVRTIY